MDQYLLLLLISFNTKQLGLSLDYYHKLFITFMDFVKAQLGTVLSLTIPLEPKG